MADSLIQAFTGKLVDYLVDLLKKQLSYLGCYFCNVQILADELKGLNDRHEDVQRNVDAARADLKVITSKVEDWLKQVEELKSRIVKILGNAEEIQRSSVCKWFPLLRYSLSRKAFKAVKDSVKLRNTNLDMIFNPINPSEIAPVPYPSNVGFKSRDLIEGRIMDALKDPSVYSIGIWGIGGVGKTVMAKKIAEKLHKSLFEHVVMVVVSQQPDLQKIQNQIAAGLSLTLSEVLSPFDRRKILHKRLEDEKSILIILDDLWRSLELEELGIPSQSANAGCKLLLTSRNRDALTFTGVPDRNIYKLEILTEEESWRFFKDKASIDNASINNALVQIAKKVERECKGLPLALKIVASALKGKKDMSLWNNAVRELEKSRPYNITGLSKDVYGPLQYSIKALEGKEQQDLFLLCCLFPEDYFISIEELLRCGIGLRIFDGIENLIVVRDNVKTMLKILLSRSLLIDEDEYEERFTVRMHDVIRDVGIWIATEEGMVGSNKEKSLFMRSHRLNEWPLMMEEDSSNISNNNNNNIFISLLSSRNSSLESIVLEFMRLSFTDSPSNVPSNVHDVVIPKNFFNGMCELKVLEASSIGLVPLSIGQLNNLRTLFLRRCNISEIVSVLGKLENLEILSFEYCEFGELPLEIGRLKKLKQLDISNCKSLRRIAFGVISGLARLEELVIWGSFDSWEAEDGGEKDVACLSELNGLKNLITLKIEIKDPSVIPRQKPVWVQRLKKYCLNVPKFWSYDRQKYFQKAVILDKVVNPLGDWIYDMASDAEYLNLTGCNCMNVLKGLSQNFGNLSCLKILRLFEFTDVQYLAEGLQKGAIFPKLEKLVITGSDSLQQISDVSTPIGSFAELNDILLEGLSGLIYLWKVSIKEHLNLKNLQRLSIRFCNNLSYIFPLSVAQSLVQLSHLSVSSCKTMEEFFKRDDGDIVEINKIELPKLREMHISWLDNLRYFCAGIDRIELPELTYLSLRNLPSMKMTKCDNNEVDQWCLIPKVAGKNFNFCGLTNLQMEDVGNLKCEFSPSIINGFPNLCKFAVENCSNWEHVIGKDDEIVGQTILFPNLKELILENLPNILAFCYNTIQMPSLERLDIRECPLMVKFVEELPNHISNPTPLFNKQVQCPALKTLDLNNLKISAVFSLLFLKSLKVLEEMVVIDCGELEHVIIKEEGLSIINVEEEDFIQWFTLKKLYLRRLPKLCGSVFQIKQHMEFSSLEQITIVDCPNLEKFSLGSLHLPKLKAIDGLLNAEYATDFFFHSQMSSRKIHSENNDVIISVKNISFDSDVLENMLRYSIILDSSGTFVDVVSFAAKEIRNKIVGRFKTEKIKTGIEYEIMVMIMFEVTSRLFLFLFKENSIKIELKIPGGIKLQCTKIIEIQSREIWIEISIGKFMIKEPQQISEELEFSLGLGKQELVSIRLYTKGFKIKEV